MRYASVCDGIGAVHVAWQPLGWKCAWTSEIEPFPAAVVEHHWGLPNLGDMTKITEEMINGVAAGPIDLLAGGTPCQSFSVAGLRRGLDDPRGNLALRFLQLAGVLRPTWVVWENVPGVLSSGGGRDFGAFLGALGNLGYGFAYRVLDAQWFGVAQRRRRVFVVGHARDWRRAAAVLFERESLCGNPPTRGKAWQGTARATAASLTGSGRGVARTGESRGQDDVVVCAFGGNNTSGPIDVAPSCMAHGGPHGRQDFASEAFVVSDDPTHAICANEQRTYTNEGSIFQLRNVVAQAFSFKPGQSEAAGGTFVTDDFAPTLQSQNNGSTAVPAVAFKPSHYTRGKDGAPSEVFPPLSADADKGDQDPVVAVATAGGVDLQNAAATGDLCSTLDAEGQSRGNRGSGVMVPMTLEIRGRSDGCSLECRQDGTANALRQPNGGRAGVGIGAVATSMAVRRLTPRECERLQGFRDDYTAITFKGKPAADGPRYRALGNSMAVPVMRWIGERIAMVERLVP